jgi:hypothetical protein
MAVPSGTYQTYTAVGRREDLTDVIHDISPTDTPFMSNIGKGSATRRTTSGRPTFWPPPTAPTR